MMTLNHGLSGYVCGRVAAPLIHRRSGLPEGLLAFGFLLGAALPDVDALANVLGAQTYFSGAWYGQRHASHSIVGTWVLALIAAAPLALWAVRRREIPWRRAYPWLVLCAWLGGLLHIVGDLFTPRWPLPIFWPLPGEYGAFSHIGWFSPFLLWFFLGVLALEGLIRIAVRWPLRAARWQGFAVWGLYAFAAWRWIDYLVDSRYVSPTQWEAYQHTLLPEAMIGPASATVHALWHWMVR